LRPKKELEKREERLEKFEELTLTKHEKTESDMSEALDCN
jgi:hypothetical protein